MRKETALFVIFLAVLIVGFFYNIGPMLAATPTPVKISELTPVTTVTPASLLYIVQGATPASRQANVEAAVRSVYDLHYGSAAGCSDGTTIAHGLGVTPTVVLMTPYSAVTVTVYVKASDTTSITVGLVGGAGAADVYWMAGR